MNIKKIIQASSFFVSLLFMGTGIVTADLNQQIPSTATNTIGTQFLTPYRKELKKIDTKIQSTEEYLKNNQTASETYEQQLTALYHERRKRAHFINDNDIIFSRFALNELVKQEVFTPLIDFNDYEHNLYVACSPLDKEKDSYNEKGHLLHQLARHTNLKSGYVKWAKVLGMPTTDIAQLKQSQEVSKELLRNPQLLENLDAHLQQIKDQGLEDSFLSFWKDESIIKITSSAPYATNSTFGPIIEMYFALEKMRGGDLEQLQELVSTLDQTPAFIGTINWTTFIQDAGMVIFGVGMLTKGWEDLKSATLAIPKDLEYLGNFKLLAMPIILPIISKITDEVINLSVKNRLKDECAKFTALCEQNNVAQYNQATVTVGKIELCYQNAHQANDAQQLVTKHMPYCKTMIETTKLEISLTAQEERELRFSHPLMQHKTLATIVVPCVLYLLACHYYDGTPLIDDKAAGDFPIISRDAEDNLSFFHKGDEGHTPIAIPIPGFTLLPWHLVKMLTCTGLIPAYAYQHFFKIPQKSMLTTTHSIQLARKALIDFAHLINHVKQIQTLLMNNQILRDNLREVEELDVEKTVTKKMEAYQTILKEDNEFFQRNGISKANLNKAIDYLGATSHELSQLLDTLQAHIDETESNEPYSWFSPTGLIKNINIRFASEDLLAAYKTMQSIKDTFAPWLEALGEVDRKVSEAKLLKEFENQQVKFCFAEYEQQEAPHLAATNLWLPHLLGKTQPENIIANDLEMGKDGQASTIILSGPTEGGKSTIERALAIAALMARTTGIVPATRWTSTPFDRVLLSFNAADNLGKTVNKTATTDTQTGTSGFRDEVESIKRIVQEKEKLGKDKRLLIIIDELFQKVQRSGEYFSYHVIGQNFAHNNNTLSLIVSHREQPKYLEQETAGRCKNYHFVLKDVNGKLVNTYQIELGALFRPEHRAVTLTEIKSNQEDAYNLQMTQEAGILNN